MGHGPTDCVVGRCLCAKGFCPSEDKYTCVEAPELPASQQLEEEQDDELAAEVSKQDHMNLTFFGAVALVGPLAATAAIVTAMWRRQSEEPGLEKSLLEQ